MPVFDVNTDEHIELTVKLNNLHRSAFPVAVRETLNDVAFETKKVLPSIASGKFITRNKAFFRAFSGVTRARGFNLSNMKSVAGILPDKGGKGSKIAEGLEKQETGGTIKGKKLIPHDKGRIRGSLDGRLRRKHRFEKIKIGNTKKKNQGKLNYILIKKGSKGTVFEIKRIGKKQKLTPVYNYRSSPNSRVKRTSFMKTSAFIAVKKISGFYIKNAKIRFEKELKRK